MTDPLPPVTGGTGRRRPDKFGGALAMAIGGMLALFCGTCTFCADWAMLSGPLWNFDLFLLSNILGGVPTATGVWLLLWGRSLYRGGPGSRADPRSN